MDKYVYGGDTETVNGEPLSFQFYSEDCACDEIFFVDKTTAARKFFDWCGKRRKHVQHVVYVHALDFDLVEFLWGYHEKLISPGGDFDFTVGKWHIKGVYGVPTFCTVSNGKDTTIYFINSYSFFRGSLANAAKLFCPSLPKLRRSQGLGEKRFTARDESFCSYAMRDAEVAYHIGRAVEKLHVEFDLQQCLSVADMAARIFRHRFLTYTIPQPSREIIEAALLSYHGGKNNLTAKSGWYENVTALDISSAYPAAMHALPAFSNEKLYKRLRMRKGSSVPDFGVYRVSGNVSPCDWPSVFSHSFKPIFGRIDSVCMQGFELNEALRSKELKASRIDGWFYDADRDITAPAFRAFVEDFYSRKEKEKDPVMRYMYKTILNSVYGKFIQTRKTSRVTYYDIDSGTCTTAAELVAGGMFHPFIASAITAMPRARIHRFEHQYKALHTATDGIFTQSRSLPRERKVLGSFNIEAQGELLLVRNKVYILYSPDGEMKSQAFKGKMIAKHAMHGFQGTVFDLERLIATGKRKYTVNRPNRLRESLKRHLRPNEFVKREYTLKIGEIPLR